MKVIIVDISGKVVEYDLALCEALIKLEDLDVLFFSPLTRKEKNHSCKVFRLLSLVPSKYKTTEAKWKRCVKAAEGLVNYFLICSYLLFHKVDIVHFQWLPYLQLVGIEFYILKLLHLISPNTKYVLTIHNIYPHNSSESAKIAYNARFRKIIPIFSRFIIHTNKSKTEAIQEFGIPENKITLAYHGIFTPKDYAPRKVTFPQSEKWNLIMYGGQSPYKGTDIFVNALSMLPDYIKSRINATICGRSEKSFLEKLQRINTGVEISWVPTFIPDDELYTMIDKSDIIVLPYRSISQSGVLLLALYFKRAIIASDLQSFKETLEGFDENMFFKSEDPQSLSELITRYVNAKIDINYQIEVIEKLSHKYSWSESAKATMKAYESIMSER